METAKERADRLNREQKEADRLQREADFVTGQHICLTGNLSITHVCYTMPYIPFIRVETAKERADRHNREQEEDERLQREAEADAKKAKERQVGR